MQDFRHEVESRESQFLAMTSESDVWADHLVPDECHNDLPSPSEESGMSHDVIGCLIGVVNVLGTITLACLGIIIACW